MAASGPKAIEVAAEIADGVLVLVGFNRGIVEKALDHLERGARRSGRRLEDLEIIWAVRTERPRPRPRPPPGSTDRGSLGHPPLGRTLGGACRVVFAETRHPRRRMEGLP